MRFMIAAYLKPGSDDQLISLSDEINEHFAQSELSVAGVLRDADGKRRGYLGFVEGESFDDAKRYVEEGPFYQRHLYERIDIFRYDLEIGQIG